MGKPKQKIVKSPVYKPTRKIPEWTKMLLFTRAGGRCEFDGCAKYLLEHPVTFTEGNFAEAAHIVAYSRKGPRGYEERPKDINDVKNLMLLCPTCHKLIDSSPDNFARATLEEYKANHEKQMFYFTGLKPDMKTSVVVVKSKIGNQTVMVSFDQILEAVAPRWPVTKDVFTIDLTQIPTTAAGFSSTARDTIANRIESLLVDNGEARKAGHISLFALMPMHLLAALGNILSNKIALDVFQRHRDGGWRWKKTGKPVKYSFKKLRSGTRADCVALLLCLSGVNRIADLPPVIDGKYSVYEITLSDLTPKPTFLQRKEDVEGFREIYHEAIGSILRDHLGVKSIHLFPAVPAPIAVLCGRELLPKVHPALEIYDKDRTKGGFIHGLTINK